MALIFVDCEGHGPAAALNNHKKFEFGAVEYKSHMTFHGKGGTDETFRTFLGWLKQFMKKPGERLIFVSDNPAYDWQFINYYFYKFLGQNPFGHSARRISDYYAGLVGDFYKTQDWKRFRMTPHDHHPVNDAMGNVEAFERLQAGDR